MHDGKRRRCQSGWMFHIKQLNVAIWIPCSQVANVLWSGIGNGDLAAAIDVVFGVISDSGANFQHRQTGDRQMQARQMFQSARIVP
jgi:hypothetical protein